VRDLILNEIRRLAEANGGKPLGFRLFESETGIRQAAWRGVYWARWSDAVAEAGLQPNVRLAKMDEGLFLTQLAEAFRNFGKVPVLAELRIYRRSHPDFPHRAIVRHFKSVANMHHRLAEWAGTNEGYADVAAMLVDGVSDAEPENKRSAEGFVYLIRWGARANHEHPQASTGLRPIEDPEDNRDYAVMQKARAMKIRTISFVPPTQGDEERWRARLAYLGATSVRAY
jgi:hypothetical protein